MRQPRQQEGSKNKGKQERFDPDRESVKIQNSEYDGGTAEYGYSQAIFDLLKEPVSLGMLGANSNRGRQR